MDDDGDIETNVQKMNRPPKTSRNIFPRIRSGNQNNHQIEGDRSQSDENRLKIRVKGNKNVSQAEFYILMEKKNDRVRQCKNKRLERYPAVKIETPKTQEIFSNFRQTGNRPDKNGNIKKQKADQAGRPDDIPVPRNNH